LQKKIHLKTSPIIRPPSARQFRQQRRLSSHVRYLPFSYTWIMKKYELFDHTADIGIEFFGRTKKELFTNAIVALKDIMIEENEIKPLQGHGKKVAVEGADTADLLVNFLREVLYLFNGKRLITVSCVMTGFAARRLTAELALVRYRPEKHTVRTELKAVTYHGLSVVKEKTRWKARVIFDV